MNTFIFERSDTFRTRKTKRWFALLSFCLMLCMGQLGIAQYCMPSSSSANYEWITNVTLAGINNTTGGSTGLNNYTSQIATVDKDLIGQEYTLSVSIEADSNEYVYVFIDWNQNGILNDSGEVYVLASGTSANGPFTTQVTVPAEAVLGSTRIRVILNYGGTPTPCTSPSFGEIEDYTVTVLGTPPACPAPAWLSATNLTYSSADLGWTSDGTAFDIKWGAPGFDVETEGNLEEDFENGGTLSGLEAETTYEFYVRQNCGEEMSDWAGPYSFYTGYCVPTGTSNSYRITGVSTSGGYTNISNLSNGTSNPYSNYTAMSVSQSPGESISYAVTVPSSTGIKIWIDLNQDLVFDETELVASHTTYMAAGNWTGTIQVPEELPLGEYRIRIRSGYYWYPEQIYACGTNYGNYGEAEDYTLSVVAPPTCFPPTDLAATNLTYSSADLGWTSDGTAFDIKWGVSGFDLETEGTLE